MLHTCLYLGFVIILYVISDIYNVCHVKTGVLTIVIMHIQIDVWITKSSEKERMFLSQSMQQGETSSQVDRI